MSRPTGVKQGLVTAARTKSAVIAADSATLTDANIPPALAIDCSGLNTIFVGVEITAGSSPTMTFEPLFYDPSAADGSRWKRISRGSRNGETAGAAAALDTGALDGTSFRELYVYGHSQVFLRCTAVANSGSTTAWTALVMAGEIRPDRSPRST